MFCPAEVYTNDKNLNKHIFVFAPRTSPFTHAKPHVAKNGDLADLLHKRA